MKAILIAPLFLIPNVVVAQDAWQMQCVVINDYASHQFASEVITVNVSQLREAYLAFKPNVGELLVENAALKKAFNDKGSPLMTDHWYGSCRAISPSTPALVVGSITQNVNHSTRTSMIDRLEPLIPNWRELTKRNSNLAKATVDAATEREPAITVRMADEVRSTVTMPKAKIATKPKAAIVAPKAAPAKKSSPCGGMGQRNCRAKPM